MHDTDWVVRLAAAQGLGSLKDKSSVAPLCEALKDDEWSVRYHAALALGDMNDKDAVIPLIKALRDRRESVRRGVVESLGRLGDKRAVAALERQRKIEESEGAKLAIAMIDMVLPGLKRGRKFEPKPEQTFTPRPIINSATIKPKAAIQAAQEAHARMAAEAAAAAAKLEDEEDAKEAKAKQSKSKSKAKGKAADQDAEVTDSAADLGDEGAGI